jgi:hypothetical protein
MQINKHGTMYDVYVKNDYFYNKGYSQSGNELDLSVDDYMRKIQNAIPELKDVSISDVSIHILPEGATNKNSSLTDEVADDIIGVVSSKYSYSADEKQQAGTLELENLNFSVTYDKSSIQNLLDKLRFVYKNDENLSHKIDKYSNPYNFLGQYTKTTTTADGLKEQKFEVSDDPLAYEIANLNAELEFDSNVSILFFKAQTTKDVLEKVTEELKRENIDTLLGSTKQQASLSSILRSMN